jgi:hypothetical protein
MALILFESAGGPVYINPENVTSVSKMQQDRAGHQYVRVKFNKENITTVVGDLDDVARRLNVELAKQD